MKPLGNGINDAHGLHEDYNDDDDDDDDDDESFNGESKGVAINLIIDIRITISTEE